MLFNSWAFAVFFSVVLLLYLPRNKHWQNFILLAGSYFFYGWWDWRFLGLLILSTVVDFTVARQMPHSDGKPRRRLLMVSLITNLGILGFFKYFGFFVDSATALLETLGFGVSTPTLSIVLPVGISFYTFQTMAYTIDVYRGRVEPTSNLLQFAVYVSFFPQLVAGPIERAQRLLPQFDKARRATREQFSSGAVLILIGLVRKIAVADVAAPVVDEVFSDLGAAGGMAIAGATLLFALQIYADFAGYSDIARGTARMMGIDLMINFEHPYFARNIALFWRQWHISLSTWLRDYLYIPLGGNRNGLANTYRNLMLTMLLGGLWHGAAWTFVVWGGIHGLALSGHRWMSSLRGKSTTEPSGSVVEGIGAWSLTMVVVMLAWIFFRAPGLGESLNAISSMLTLEGGFDRGALSSFGLFAALTGITLFIDLPQRVKGSHTAIMKWPAAIRGVSYAGMILALVLAPSAPNNSFIYFQF